MNFNMNLVSFFLDNKDKEQEKTLIYLRLKNNKNDKIVVKNS